MAGGVKRLLPVTAPPVRGIPRAILQAALFGVLIGPVLGLFFGWSGPLRAAMVSGMYCVVFFTLCALPAGYVRKYFDGRVSAKATAAMLLTNLAGIAAASLVVFAIFEERF